MQAAALLSDLKSLSVCSHEAATKLVSVHRSSAELGQTSSATEKVLSDDADLARSEQLIFLHNHVKLQHVQSGLDSNLLKARQDVNRILASLKLRS